jgi:hypothetical protein
MKRGVKGKVAFANDDELHVAELTGLCVTVFGVGTELEVFAESQEPEEGNDDQIDDAGPVGAPFWVIEIAHCE